VLAPANLGNAGYHFRPGGARIFEADVMKKFTVPKVHGVWVASITCDGMVIKKHFESEAAAREFCKSENKGKRKGD
jgi:hypothetical protein